MSTPPQINRQPSQHCQSTVNHAHKGKSTMTIPKKSRRIAALHNKNKADSIAKLKPRQQVFLAEYLSTWSGTESAKKTGYACPAVTASRMLRNANIRAAIEQVMREQHMSASLVTARLSEIANVHMADFIDEQGNLIPGCVARYGHLIKSLRINRDGSGFKLELHDAQAALDRLCRIYKLYGNSEPPTTGERPVEFVFQPSLAE